MHIHIYIYTHIYVCVCGFGNNKNNNVRNTQCGILTRPVGKIGQCNAFRYKLPGIYLPWRASAKWVLLQLNMASSLRKILGC